MMTMNVALLLEGKKTVVKDLNGNFQGVPNQPELYYLDQMAQMNGWDSFDPIVSRDLEHYTYAFSKIPAEQHEKMIHVILDFWRAKTPLDALVIKLIVHPAYTKYLQGMRAKGYPQWYQAIASTPNRTMSNAEIGRKKGEMINRLYSKTFANPMEGYEKDKLSLLTWFDNSSNRLSAEALKKYLIDNPAVTDVIGSVGFHHLGIAKLLSKEVQQRGGMANTFQCNVGGRIVNITLFGGLHGNLACYDELADYVQELGYQVPALDRRTEKFKNDLALLIGTLEHNRLPVSDKLNEKWGVTQAQNALVPQFNQMRVTQTQTSVAEPAQPEEKEEKKVNSLGL